MNGLGFSVSFRISLKLSHAFYEDLAEVFIYRQVTVWHHGYHGPVYSGKGPGRKGVHAHTHTHAHTHYEAHTHTMSLTHLYSL